ncbi:nitronate monooxygenase [Nocardioides marmorisolisilvae]|uniref:Propionate 3-nitronate monooxygenase n=2 Tax=Nocardioides marmorisolisilvae TaxID=1542737 RepID=A0A3N0DXQ6_9ACTN|nr:nitronate monooxygenase [Nocardioides marmorisolisilvae]
MAGGPTTVALVDAAATARSFGFLAAGYKSPETLAGELEAVGSERFGVNLFAPAPVPVDLAAYRAYRERLLPLAARFEVELPEVPVEDDDAWGAKVDLLVAAAPRVVSFTFGLPDAESAARLRAAGCLLAQTVTDPHEARLAADAGLDVLVVQAPAAGGHSGTFTPERPIGSSPLPDLVRAVLAVADLPVIAGGGVGGSADVRVAMAAGASAVAVGTLLLLADEAGTSATYRGALTGAGRGDPVLTRAYSGRPARGLPTAFMAAHDAAAPLGYPALHHLTTPIRRAAAAAGDAENINLWAGTGYRAATAAPAAQILSALAR